MIKVFVAIFSIFTGIQVFSQSTMVSPRPLASIEGNISNYYPFGFYRYSSWTYQQIHCDLKGKSMLITQIAFRPDKDYKSSSRRFRLTLTVSSTARTWANISKYFSLNHGGDKTTVVSNKTIDWPQDQTLGGPKPFIFKIPFPSKPFLYKNTPGFCWEVRIHSHNIPNFKYYPLDCFTARYSYGAKKIGYGCKSSGSTLEANMQMRGYFYTSPDRWQIYQSSQRLCKNQPAIWILGDSSKKLGNINLPLDLSLYGAKGCKLYTNIVNIRSGKLTSRTGAFSDYFYIPYLSVLVDKWIYGQTVSLDPNRPGLGLVFANGYGIELAVKPEKHPVSRAYTFFSDRATKALYVNINFGLIIQITYK